MKQYLYAYHEPDIDEFDDLADGDEFDDGAMWVDDFGNEWVRRKRPRHARVLPRRVRRGLEPRRRVDALPYRLGPRFHHVEFDDPGPRRPRDRRARRRPDRKPEGWIASLRRMYRNRMR